MNDIITIRFVESPLEKTQIASEVLLDLPEWFGLPENTKEYIETSKQLPLWVAEVHKTVLGFIVLRSTSDESAEIYCMGVKKDFHRKGIGNLLYTALENYAQKSYNYIQVKTVDEGHYKEYDQTIAFYKSIGFSKLEVFPTLWDEWNPCLILIKSLK